MIKLKIPFGFGTWITLFSCFFMLSILIENTNQVLSLRLTYSSYIYLIIAVLIGMISIYVNGLAWNEMLAWMSSKRISSNHLINLYVRTNHLKYLPGGIWHFVARLRTLGLIMDKGLSFKAVIFDPLLMVSVALIFVPLGQWKSGLSLILFLPSMFIFTKWLEPVLEKIGSIKFTSLSNIVPEFKDYDYKLNSFTKRDKYPIRPFLIESLFILIRFSGFNLCLYAFELEYSASVLATLSAFSLAWSIGLVVPAAPGGIGVFESAFLFQLPSDVPKGAFIAVLVSYRLVVTLSDLLAGIIANLTKQKLSTS